jgi:tripartite-type tricarboxylate transporter receptor subunit TctC
MRNLVIRWIVALLTVTATATGAWSNTYPTRPIFLIVPFAPGGATDVLARYIAEKLGSSLGQPVLVDNRPGGGGITATDYVIRAPKDGYTLLFQTPALAVLAATKKGQSLDIKGRLAPVSLVAAGPFVLVTNNTSPAHSAADLIKLVKSNPAKMNFGSPGSGTSVHLAGELFKAMAGLDVVHVPYRGNAPALIGLMSNDIQFMFDTLATSLPLAEDNKLRILAVSTKERYSGAPDTPSLNESALPGYDSGVWMGVLAPKGTPTEIADKVSDAIKKLLQSDDIKKQLAVQGLEPKGLSPAEFGKMLLDETSRLENLIRDQKIEIE